MGNHSFKIILSKLFFQTIGQTSDGVRMCFQHGLTSGKMLDYIYRNQPAGSFGVGKLIDKEFLNHPGWEAVRTRRKHLEELLTEAVEDLRRSGKAISLMDVASGPASYILSVLNHVGEKGITTLCQDFDERWVKEGAEEAKRQGLKNIRFRQGDAFNAESLKAVHPTPNVFVSSGFYDWFSDDEDVKKSIRILNDVLPSGGYFVMTNQAAHPNLEFVQGVFPGFDNKPLEMTMRPEATVRSWLKEAGFTIERTLIDEHGYYSVFKARKE